MNLFYSVLLRCLQGFIWVADVSLAVLFLFAEGILHLLWLVLSPVVPLEGLQNLIYIGQSRKAARALNPDLERDFVELVVSKGYKVEEHFVQTKDGYILGLHRILPACPVQDGERIGSKGVVFFQHGFMQNSEVFIVRGPGKSLPYMLVDLGYDVWLGNNRGNKYSYKHISRSPKEDKFWDFCLDDLACFDLPAMIYYVLAETGSESLSYVGFSQGTAQAFAGFSSNSKLASKINNFIALAPSTRVKELRNPICASLAKSKPQLLFLIFGKKMMLSFSLFWRKVLTHELYAQLIDTMMYFLFGWTCTNILASEKPLLYSHLYSYSSVKCMVQWFQITASRRFQMYDDNIKVTQCGEDARCRPYALPCYHPAQIKVPMHLFCGDKDTVPDTDWLLKQVPPQTFVHREESYEHLDFLWAYNAPERVFSQVVNIIEKHYGTMAIAS